MGCGWVWSALAYQVPFVGWCGVLCMCLLHVPLHERVIRLPCTDAAFHAGANTCVQACDCRPGFPWCCGLHPQPHFGADSGVRQCDLCVWPLCLALVRVGVGQKLSPTSILPTPHPQLAGCCAMLAACHKSCDDCGLLHSAANGQLRLASLATTTACSASCTLGLCTAHAAVFGRDPHHMGS